MTTNIIQHGIDSGLIQQPEKKAKKERQKYQHQCDYCGCKFLSIKQVQRFCSSVCSGYAVYERFKSWQIVRKSSDNAD